MARYDVAFWSGVVTRAPARALMGKLFRLVEHQEQKVTVSLVDTLDEHEVLEQMIESSKPVLQPELRRFDYLLRALWRYSPLPWGSRFGRRFEPGIFYGALSEEALLAEAAYYRLVFLEGMERAFADRVISQHTRFEARYQADDGRQLEEPPFRGHEAVLRHPAQYGPCQELGSVLRERGVVAFTYVSARAEGRELNIALIEPRGLTSRKHRNPVQGLCTTRPEGVQFRFGDRLFDFARERFLIDGMLPLPAA